MNKLSDMKIGQKAKVISYNQASPLKRRLQDLGLIKDTQVECLGRSPLGDPSAYLIRGAVVAIRANDARAIEVAIWD